MWYAIVASDIANSLPLRKQARPAHLARLEDQKAAGRLLLAGPHPAIDSEDPGESGFTGSLVVAEFASLEDAQAWAAAIGPDFDDSVLQAEDFFVKVNVLRGWVDRA